MPYKDPDKARERARAYRQANRDKELERNRAYKDANRDKILEINRAYYKANGDKIREKQRAYYKANRDKVLERNRAWHKANAEYCNEQGRRRRERMLRIPAPRSGEKWTDAEDAVIIANLEATNIELAYMLGRTHEAVGARIKKLKLNRQAAK